MRCIQHLFRLIIVSSFQFERAITFSPMIPPLTCAFSAEEKKIVGECYFKLGDISWLITCCLQLAPKKPDENLQNLENSQCTNYSSYRSDIAFSGRSRQALQDDVITFSTSCLEPEISKTPFWQ